MLAPPPAARRREACGLAALALLPCLSGCATASSAETGVWWFATLALLLAAGAAFALGQSLERQRNGRELHQARSALQRREALQTGWHWQTDARHQLLCDSFSFTVSHDLRAPIRVVEGFTRIVKEDYGRQLDRVGNDHLDRVLGAAARMNQMIDALLTLAKLSQQPLARQPVNLSQLAGFVVDDLRRSAPNARPRSRSSPACAQGDPTLLRLVLENLLGNAWKYSARSLRAQISLRRVPHGPAAFVVRDNGAGFDMRSADRLFGLFQRLHSASDFPGTGVGPGLGAAHRAAPWRRGLGRGRTRPRRGLLLHAGGVSARLNQALRASSSTAASSRSACAGSVSCCSWASAAGAARASARGSEWRCISTPTASGTGSASASAPPGWLRLAGHAGGQAAGATLSRAKAASTAGTICPTSSGLTR
jgi:signal transduction histidine kinase